MDANEQAHRLDPGAAAPTNRKLNALIDAGRLEEVRHELDRNGTRLRPLYRADALLALGQPAEAMQALSPGSPKSGDRNPRLPTLPCGQSPTPDSAVGRTRAHPGGSYPCGGEPDRALPYASHAVSHWKHACRSRPLRRGGALAHEGRRRGLPVVSAVLNGSKPRALKGHAGFAALLARLRQDQDRWQKTL